MKSMAAGVLPLSWCHEKKEMYVLLGRERRRGLRGGGWCDFGGKKEKNDVCTIECLSAHRSCSSRKFCPWSTAAREFSEEICCVFGTSAVLKRRLSLLNSIVLGDTRYFMVITEIPFIPNLPTLFRNIAQNPSFSATMRYGGCGAEKDEVQYIPLKSLVDKSYSLYFQNYAELQFLRKPFADFIEQHSSIFHAILSVATFDTWPDVCQNYRTLSVGNLS